MTEETLRKEEHHRTAVNMPDYNRAVDNFSWQEASEAMGGPKPDMLNIAYEAVDRQVDDGHGDTIALRWKARDGKHKDFSYADLKRETDRFGRLLHDLGVNPGDRVYSLLGRIPELYIAALGSLKAGAIFCPLRG